jgi:dTDP-L-rhamnose 4-epimerase
MNARTVLITGGAGFIGSHLIRRLSRTDWTIRVLDNLSPQIHGHIPSRLEWLSANGAELLRGSVTDPLALRQALEGVEAVVHLSAETGTAQSMYEIAHYNKVNSQGTAQLLQALENLPEKRVRRVLLASSRSIYGEGAYRCDACSTRRIFPAPRSASQLSSADWQPRCPECTSELTAIPTRETDPPSPASIYAATKLAQEDLIRIGCHSMGIDHCILRLQNVFGEGQSLQNPYTGIISIFSTRLRRGLQLPLFEDGLCTRDFVHVHDVAEAFARALEHPAQIGATINVGSGVPTTIRDVAHGLATALGVNPELVVTGQYRLGDIRHNCADLTALRATLGFSPQITVSEGLRHFVEWLKTEPVPADRLEQANRELISRKLMA